MSTIFQPNNFIVWRRRKPEKTKRYLMHFVALAKKHKITVEYFIHDQIMIKHDPSFCESDPDYSQFVKLVMKLDNADLRKLIVRLAENSTENKTKN